MKYREKEVNISYSTASLIFNLLSDHPTTWQVRRHEINSHDATVAKYFPIGQNGI